MTLIRFKKKNNNQTDEALMLSIQQGDVASFDELYARFNQRLYYYFFRMLGNEHQVAEDFVQELFLKIIQNTKAFDCKRTFTTWVFSMAHNMCKNEYRSRAVRSIMCNEENADAFVEDEESVGEGDEKIHQIFEVINALDEHHKTIFLLKYREGFTIDEICDICELPKGTVKSRLFYARKKIQELIPTTTI